MLSCLSLFIAVMIVVGCVLGLYSAEARHYTKLSGEPSSVFDEIWDDFGPRVQAAIRRTPPVVAPSPPQP